ncbi:N-acetyltransferase [Paenibacillus sp. 1011MAR3C5]|nr:N-acetyltransferase [Paenibacillus sp. 1011MAR3C5]
MPRLETERTILRKISLEDAADMFEYCSDDEVSQYTTWNSHQSIEDTRAFIQYILNKYDQQQLAPWGIEDKATGKFIGSCGYVDWVPNHARGELAYALSRSYWNRGYMTEIVKRLIEIGFEKMGLVRIEARCLTANIGSARVMEKSGLIYEGTMSKVVFCKGAHHDLKLYALVKDNQDLFDLH